MPPSSAKNLPPAETIEFEARVAGRDELRLQLIVSGDEITESRLTGIGCSETLALLVEWRPKLAGRLSQLPLPEGNRHAEIMLRELIMKAQGNWRYPYADEELCHCRAVSTKRVDDAIIGGCHTAAAVSRATSAGTSCGSCRPDTEAILAYRLKR